MILVRAVPEIGSRHEPVRRRRPADAWSAPSSLVQIPGIGIVGVQT